MLTHKDFEEFVVYAQREGIDINKTPIRIPNKCHPEKGCDIIYIGKGILKVSCYECSKLLEYIKVGEVE